MRPPSWIFSLVSFFRSSDLANCIIRSAPGAAAFAPVAFRNRAESSSNALMRSLSSTSMSPSPALSARRPMRPASLVSACLSCSCSLAISSRSLMTGFFTCRFPLDRKCPERRHDLSRKHASAHPIKSDRSAAPTSFAIIPPFRRNGSKGAVIRCEATLRAPPEGKDQFG